MQRVRIKTKSGEIVLGYLLKLQGEHESKCESFFIIAIPPCNGEDCPCLVFANKVYKATFDFKEIGHFPFINLYDKQDVMQLLKVYKTSTE